MDMMDPLPNVKQEKIQLQEINEYLTCPLCKGYFIDATTISECLHSFCRSCIIKFLQDNSHCPICEVIINKAKPNIKLDKTLQDIVYKLVPELFIREMARRQEFYRTRPAAAAKATPEERGVDTERTIFNPKDAISLCIEYISDDSTPGAITVPEHGLVRTKQDEAESQMKRFLQCPGNCRIEVLKKFVQNKYNVDVNRFHIEVLYKRVPLPNHYTLIDIAYIYSWKRNEPMKFFFRIMDQNPTTEKPDISNHIFVKPPRSYRDRSKKVKDVKISKESKIDDQDLIDTDQIKAEIKNSLGRVDGKGPVFTNITLNRKSNVEIITKVQKVSNKNGQPIGLNIIKKTVKKSEKCRDKIEEELPKIEDIVKQEGFVEETMGGDRKISEEKHGGQKQVLSGRKQVFGGQKQVVGGQKSVFGDSKRVFDDQKSVFCDQKSVFGDQKSVFGDQKSVFGDLKQTDEKIKEEVEELDESNTSLDDLKIDEDLKVEDVLVDENQRGDSPKVEKKPRLVKMKTPENIDHYDFAMEEAKVEQGVVQQSSYRNIHKSPFHQKKPPETEDASLAQEDDEKSKFLKSIELTAKTALETLHQVHQVANNTNTTSKSNTNATTTSKNNTNGQIFLKITQKRKNERAPKSEKVKRSKRKNSPVKNVMKVEKMLESLNRNASDLQSIFTNCKFNIPSSLSITLKETSEEDGKGLVKMEPVKNYIEILKIPDGCGVSKELEGFGGFNKDLVPKELVVRGLVRKDLESRDLFSKELMSRGLIPKDLMSKDVMSKDVMSKDLLSKDEMSKDLNFHQKNLSSKGQMFGDLMSRDFLRKDLASEDLSSKELLFRELMSREFHQKDFSSKNSASKDVMSEDLMSRDFLQKNLGSKDLASKKLASKDLMSEDMMSRDVLQKDLGSKNSASKDLISRGLLQKDLASKDLASKDLMSKDLRSRDFLQKDLASKDLASKDLMSKDLRSRDFLQKDLASKDLASKDLMSKDLRSRDFLQKDLASGDLASKNLASKDVFSKSLSPSKDQNAESNSLKSKSAPNLGQTQKTSFQRMFEESLKSPTQNQANQGQNQANQAHNQANQANQAHNQAQNQANQAQNQLNYAQKQPNKIQKQLNQEQNQPNQVQNEPNQFQNQANQPQNPLNQAQNQLNYAQKQPNKIQKQLNQEQNQPNQVQNEPNQFQNQANQPQNPLNQAQNQLNYAQKQPNKIQKQLNQEQNQPNQVQNEPNQFQNQANQPQNPLNQAQNHTNQPQNPTNQIQNPPNQAQNHTNQAQNPTNQAQNPTNQAQNPTNQAQNPTNQAQNQSNQAQNQPNQALNQSNHAQSQASQPNSKRSLTMITNQLAKKSKLDVESTQAKTMSTMKSPPPTMRFQQISAKLRSPSLGMNFTVSVDQPSQSAYGKLDSVFCDFAKKTDFAKKADFAKKSDFAQNITQNNTTNITQNNTPNITQNIPQKALSSPKTEREENLTTQNGLSSPEVQRSHVQIGGHIIGVVQKSPKPLDLVQNVSKLVQTPKKSTQAIPLLPKPPKDSNHANHGNANQTNHENLASFGTNGVQNVTNSSNLSTNQILEKYKIQNLAQLSAQLNFNQVGGQPGAQMALQQAILKQFEMQNQQNWRMGQFQGYHHRGQGNLPPNRLLSKEN